MLFERGVIVFFMLLFSLLAIKTTVSNIHFNINNEVVQEEPKIVARPVSPKQVECLATGIYYEAASESFMGQVAVARVIVNRVLHGFGSNPCKVVYQTTVTKDEDDNLVKMCQFSWACTGKPVPSEKNPRYQRALDIARQVLTEDKWNDVLPNNTLFFHNLQVAPRWVYKRVTTIGNHVFYSKGREKKTESTTVADK